MRTIFITSFHPLISRNILGTDLVRRLTEAGNRIVLVVPDFKKVFFERFASDRVVLEGLTPAEKKNRSFFREFFFLLTPSRGVYIKHRSQLFRDRNYVTFFFALIPAFVFGRFPLLIRFFRWLDARPFLCPDSVADLFTRYRPSLVFSTDVQQESDVRFLQFATRAGIATAGMVRSWDNLTTKGILRALPQTLIVQNESARREAVDLSGVPEEAIAVVGIPHYDRYLSRTPCSREDFFSRMKLDTQKPLIVYAPIGDRYIVGNGLDWLTIKTLGELDANILVRLPPTVEVTLGVFENTRATIIFDQPGTHPWIEGYENRAIKDNELTEDDDDRLADMLAHADVLVAGQSTIIIDAALLDVPTVIINFDERPRDYYDSIRRYYDYDYFAPVRRLGGVRFAESPDRLLSLVREYLADPERDRPARQQLAEGLAYRLDRKATERLESVLATALNAGSFAGVVAAR